MSHTLDGLLRTLEKIAELQSLIDPDDHESIENLKALLFKACSSDFEGNTDLEELNDLSAKLNSALLDDSSEDIEEQLETLQLHVSQLLLQLTSPVPEENASPSTDFEEEGSVDSDPDAAEDGELLIPASERSSSIDPEMFSKCLEHTYEILEALETNLLSLNNEVTQEVCDDIMRQIHTLKGDSGFLGLREVEQVCHATETAMNEKPLADILDMLFNVKDWLEETFQTYEDDGAFLKNPRFILDHFTEVDSIVISKPEPEVESAPDSPQEIDDLEAMAEALIAENSTIPTEPGLELTESELAEFAIEPYTTQASDTEEVKSEMDLESSVQESLESPALEEESEPEPAELSDEPVPSEQLDTELSTTEVESTLNPQVPTEEEPAEEEPADPVEPEAPQEITQTSEPAPSSIDAASEDMLEDDSDERMGDFINEALEHLDNSAHHLLDLEINPHNKKAIDGVFQAFHAMNEACDFPALTSIQNLGDEVENTLVKVREGELTIQGEVIDVIFDSVDLMRELVSMLSDFQAGDTLPDAPPEFAPLLGRLNRLQTPVELSDIPEPPPMDKNAPRLGDILVEEGVISRDDVEKAVEELDSATTQHLAKAVVQAGLVSEEQLEDSQKIVLDSGGKVTLEEALLTLGSVTQDALESVLDTTDDTRPKIGDALVDTGVNAGTIAKALRTQKTPTNKKELIKVDYDRLTGLVDMIGELVIAESMVSLSDDLNAAITPKLAKYVAQLDKITRDLQEMGTSLRMMPIKGTFQKMARIVRDLAKKSGKKVNLVMTGEDTELDKVLIDTIGAPLVHLVRNAIDHGLESSMEERLKVGKPPAGRVDLRAYHKGGNIYIEIQDDGHGLNRERILEKAIEQGLIEDGSAMEDSEVWNLVLEPGFSTAEKVTEISGRGVGMDVVRRNIESLRGSIEIKSEQGEGSTFSISLPLTLAIIDGMTLRCGQERFILPTLSVKKLLRPNKSDFSSILESGQVLNVEGNLVPLFYLGDLLGIADAVTDYQEGVVIVIESNTKSYAIVVDEVLGKQQTVLKSLGEYLSGTVGLSGGAIMSDGTVGLILDVTGILKLVQKPAIKRNTRTCVAIEE